MNDHSGREEGRLVFTPEPGPRNKNFAIGPLSLRVRRFQFFSSVFRVALLGDGSSRGSGNNSDPWSRNATEKLPTEKLKSPNAQTER
jgi:hypothetical protein